MVFNSKMGSFLKKYHQMTPECLTIDDLLVKLDKRLEKEAGDRVSAKELSKIIESKNPFFSTRLYQLIPKVQGENPHRSDVVNYIAGIVKGDADTKMQFYFRLVDTDNDQRITEEEVKNMLMHSVQENRYIFDDVEVAEMARLVMQKADMDKDGYIRYEEFKALFDSYQISEKIGEVLANWLLAKPRHTAANNRKTKKVSLTYIRNNVSSFVFLIIIALITFILCVERVCEYHHASAALMFARASGQCLNFFSSLILVLVLRRSITFLRTSGFSTKLLDKNLYYHKLCGYLIVVFALIHTIGHAIESGGSEGYLTSFHYGRTGARIVAGSAPGTGCLLWIPLIVIIISSLPMVRKNGHFEVFHFCHLLYFVYWGILLLHGPSFWIWMLIPGIAFLIERWMLIKAKYGSSGKTYVEQASILSQNVVQLVIKRPPNLFFKPGDWIYVQIPSIARWEWHPFTISSAPEIEDTLWLHIRPVGTWTKKVFLTVKELGRRGIVVFPPNQRTSLNYRICENFDDRQVEKIGRSKFYISECRIDISNSSFLNTAGNLGPFQDNIIQMSPIHSSPTSTSRIHEKPSTGSTFDFYSLKNIDLDQNFNLSRRPQTESTSAERTRELSKRLSAAYPSSNIKIRNPPTVVFLSTPGVAQGRCGDPDDKLVINRSEYQKMLDLYNHSYEAYEPSRETVSRKIIKVNSSLDVRIDGPYGSPSSQIFNAEHAVLISTGIGFTPFASILRSIMIKYLDSRQQCPHCSNWFNRSVPASLMKLKKVDFVWINRDQHNLEWFIHLLSQLEITQAQLEEVNERRFLNMHIYITSAIKSEADIRAAFLRLVLDNLNSGRDLVTGLKTRTKPGRPDWEEFFHEIKQSSKGRVDVFYCGPPELGRELHHYANLYQFGFHKEVF